MECDSKIGTALALEEAAAGPARDVVPTKSGGTWLPLAAFLLIVILVIRASMDKPEPRASAPAQQATEQ